MGPIEEAGSTARSLFESMRESPVTLSLVIFNIVFLGVFYFSQNEEREFRTKLVDYMVQTNSATAEMLYKTCGARTMVPWPLPEAPEPKPAPPLRERERK